MDLQEAKTLAEAFIAAWNTQETEKVLACYSEDCIYLDPNTRGKIEGHEPFGRYLKKLFANWDMEWFIRELHLFEDGGGVALLWHAKLKSRSAEKVVEADGMDLVMVKDGKICRNEVYFDRAALMGV